MYGTTMMGLLGGGGGALIFGQPHTIENNASTLDNSGKNSLIAHATGNYAIATYRNNSSKDAKAAIIAYDDTITSSVTTLTGIGNNGSNNGYMGLGKIADNKVALVAANNSFSGTQYDILGTSGLTLTRSSSIDFDATPTIGANSNSVTAWDSSRFLFNQSDTYSKTYSGTQPDSTAAVSRASASSPALITGDYFVGFTQSAGVISARVYDFSSGVTVIDTETALSSSGTYEFSAVQRLGTSDIYACIATQGTIVQLVYAVATSSSISLAGSLSMATVFPFKGFAAINNRSILILKQNTSGLRNASIFKISWNGAGFTLGTERDIDTLADNSIPTGITRLTDTTAGVIGYLQATNYPFAVKVSGV